MGSFHNAVFSSFTEGSFTRGEEQRRGVRVGGVGGIQFDIRACCLQTHESETTE